MDGPRNQILTGTRFPENKNGYVSCRNRFDLLQNPPQTGAFPDNVLKSVLGVEFLFEIAFFAFSSFQFLLERALFPKGRESH